ncbi:MAG TPA: FAD-binding protein, partial [Thermoleophilia bacterium]|nr:FAD-binding protein [Thermoleophilia bacterium]
MGSDAGDRVVRRGDADYERRRRAAVWNHRVPARYPELIVVARSVDDVVGAVETARARGLRVAVRSHGHNWAGTALRDGSLLLDVGGLNGLRLSGDEAEVGPGLTGAELTAALAAQGLGFPAGHCRDVGLGGYLLGGGMGWNWGVWGPACHSVAGLEAVTADGRVLARDDEDDDGLLWAARGAGPGFFAVVTRFRIRVYPEPSAAVTSTFVFPLGDLALVADWVAGLAETLDRRVELTLFLTTAPSSIGELGIEAGRHVIIVTATAFAASHGACGALLAPLERGAGR